MKWRIPLFKIYWDREDLESTAEILRAGMHWAEGKEIREFEDRISGYVGRKYCVVFNSGTSALQAALLAYEIKKGDEVIVPSFTFIATANAPLFVGAEPIFADIEEETFGLDPVDVKKKITQKTKAIIPIHYGGCPCRIEKLQEIAKKYKLVLIEDAAESFGAKIYNKKIGTFGDSAMFSFCQNKIITTGEGGAIVTDSKHIYEKLKLLRSHGRREGKNYFSSTEASDYICLGYNFRMPTLIAALGLTQINKADKVIKMRRGNAAYLTSLLMKTCPQIILPNPPKSYFHVYQLYTLRMKKYRDDLKEYLASKGIMTKVYFYPVHLTRFYRSNNHKKNRLPVTEKLAEEVLSLPMFPGIEKKELDYMAQHIQKFIKEHK